MLVEIHTNMRTESGRCVCALHQWILYIVSRHYCCCSKTLKDEEHRPEMPYNIREIL